MAIVNMPQSRTDFAGFQLLANSLKNYKRQKQQEVFSEGMQNRWQEYINKPILMQEKLDVLKADIESKRDELKEYGKIMSRRGTITDLEKKPGKQKFYFKSGDIGDPNWLNTYKDRLNALEAQKNNIEQQIASYDPQQDLLMSAMEAEAFKNTYGPEIDKYNPFMTMLRMQSGRGGVDDRPFVSYLPTKEGELKAGARGRDPNAVAAAQIKLANNMMLQGASLGEAQDYIAGFSGLSSREQDAAISSGKLRDAMLVLGRTFADTTASERLESGGLFDFNKQKTKDMDRSKWLKEIRARNWALPNDVIRREIPKMQSLGYSKKKINSLLIGQRYMDPRSGTIYRLSSKDAKLLVDTYATMSEKQTSERNKIKKKFGF